MAVDIPVFPPLLLSKISVAMGFYSQGVSKIGPILLANSKVPKFVCPTSLL
jgi:hypothetical protein